MKAEDLLGLVLLGCESLMRPIGPSYGTLCGSSGEWASARGVRRQLSRLEDRDLVVSEPGGRGRRAGGSLERVYRLTDLGRLQALGGKDPEAAWSRRWDGVWRLVSFDVPNTERLLRDKLRRELRRQGFGHLQNSAWVSPHPLNLNVPARGMAGATVDPRSLIVFEARPCAGESPLDVVSSAWDFGRINAHYRLHQEVLAARPEQAVDTTGKVATPEALNWVRREREAWGRAAKLDPFLPQELLPPGYLGREAWKQRLTVLSTGCVTWPRPSERPAVGLGWA